MEFEVGIFASPNRIRTYNQSVNSDCAYPKRIGDRRMG